MATIDEELGLLETQLDQWTEQLDALVALVARVEGLGPDVVTDRQERIDVLRTRHEAARSQRADAMTARSDRTIHDPDGTWSDVESKFFNSQ